MPSAEIEVGGGRTLHRAQEPQGRRACSASSGCAAKPRGAADYLAIARAYHTVILVGIPRMGPENRNEAARFVTLIDALYEHKVKLIAAADAAPEELYAAGDGRFEFERTVSRLTRCRARIIWRWATARTEAGSGACAS